MRPTIQGDIPRRAIQRFAAASGDVVFGTQQQRHWVPAFAGMTAEGNVGVTWIAAFSPMARSWIPAFAGMTS